MIQGPKGELGQGHFSFVGDKPGNSTQAIGTKALVDFFSNTSQRLNRYAYVQNNPISAVDPEGLWTISVGVFTNGALGIGGGGGMALNFGYSNSSGFSFSLAGTTQGGAIAGASAFVGGGISVTNAFDVNQLNGISYQFGRAGFGMGPSFAVEGVKGSDYYGGTLYGGIGPGYTANSFTASTTSAIIQYDNGLLSIGNNGTSSIWSKKLN